MTPRINHLATIVKSSIDCMKLLELEQTTSKVFGHENDAHERLCW